MERLRRWITGEATHEEERQLAQLAEEDPFLAEALEGYHRHPEGRHAERVEQLKARVREKGRRKRTALFYLPRAAAAAILLAIVAGGFWYINQDGGGTPALAVQEKPAEQAEEAAPESDADASGTGPGKDETASLPAPKEPAAQAPKAPSPPKEAPARPKKQAAQLPPPASRELARAEPLTLPPRGGETKIEADEVEPYSLKEQEIAAAAEERKADETAGFSARARKEPSAPAAKPAAPAGQGRRVTGIVTGPDGAPLIGASVLLEGTARGTATDIDGRFVLQVPDSSSANLVVNYTGYESQIVPVGGEDSLAIALTEGEALLDQVVVTGYATGRETPLPAPRPENGFEELRRYIRENLKYPEAARKNGTEGKVKLAFRIKADGSPGDFKIKKGLGDGCDEEAIRLLREGPKWEGAGQEVEYTVRFKL
ncbi:MAG: TonB family protein [Phaeodactylibacter sp.]|nr:TonB family protein [Phaeodactylibacter sp.]